MQVSLYCFYFLFFFFFFPFVLNSLYTGYLRNCYSNDKQKLENAHQIFKILIVSGDSITQLLKKEDISLEVNDWMKQTRAGWQDILQDEYKQKSFQEWSLKITDLDNANIVNKDIIESVNGDQLKNIRPVHFFPDAGTRDFYLNADGKDLI